MRIEFLPHARRRMAERQISEDEARAVLEDPDVEYPGNIGRIVAEKTLPDRRLATKVVYNVGLENERIVVTVDRGKPSEARR